MTADFSHLPEPIRSYVGITAGGGPGLYVTYMGSGQFDMEIGGTVLAITLSDVLHVPD